MSAVYLADRHALGCHAAVQALQTLERWQAQYAYNFNIHGLPPLPGVFAEQQLFVLQSICLVILCFPKDLKHSV